MVFVMRKIITYGTFDILHIGHVNLLRRAKQYGDYLIVGVSTDDFNAIKGKRAYYPFEHRKAIVESIRYVDKVIPEKSWSQKERDIHCHGIDSFIIGDDWRGNFDYLSKLCKVIYLPRTTGVSSTKTKSDLGEL